jgi:hypothetical protein
MTLGSRNLETVFGRERQSWGKFGHWKEIVARMH